MLKDWRQQLQKSICISAEVLTRSCCDPIAPLSLQHDKQNCISSSQKKKQESHQELLPVPSISLQMREVPDICFDFLRMSSAYHWTGMDNYPFRTGQWIGRVRNRQCAPSNMSLQEHKTSISTQILLNLFSAWKADSEARKGRGRTYIDNRACRQHVKHSGASITGKRGRPPSVIWTAYVSLKTCFSLNVSLGNRRV